MLNGVLSTADLLAATSYESVGALRRSLDKQGVPYFLGRDGPWTTIELVNSAKLKDANSDNERYSPEML
ncbi:hypothetical protein [Dokdonella soli]|uniref:DUF4224 domain-containing protein n=1 Tax=Dokdonella soli TaxID=529810 RepID=A0ABN1IUI4_9GAMM